MSRDCDVIVVGGGPAGSAVASGVAKLGHGVTVIAAPRRFDAIEGVARRAVDWLRHAGLASGFDDIAELAPREAVWNVARTVANHEHLVSRRHFDSALHRDLSAAEVRVRRITARHLTGVSVQLADGDTLHARLVVDARGRSGNRAAVSPRQHAPLDALRGPGTLSIAQTWQGASAAPATAVFAFADGWGWLARRGDGTRVTQLTIAADTPDLPRRAALTAWLTARIASLPLANAWVHGCVPKQRAVARASTALFRSPWREQVLRVGDAAMAVDPLSGSGIFQALSSASVAPAVINTMLQDNDARARATEFYRDRCRHLFERFARIGRDFYRAEARWRDEPFWRARRAWPDDEPAHELRSHAFRGIERRAVVDNGFITEREVVVTDDQPLGVWRVDGVEVAPLVRELEPLSPSERRARLATSSPGLKAWCKRVALIL